MPGSPGPRPARLVLVLLALSFALAGALACPRSEGGPPERIVLIVVDTLRRDHVAPYGSRVPTPNLQRLADEGQVFENAVASFHQTTMSMAALFTGRTPSLESGDPARSLPWNGRNWCGLARFSAGPDDSCVPQSLTTVAEDLRAAGYTTAGVVSNLFLFRPAGYDQGFDEWVEVGETGLERSEENRPVLVRSRRGEHVQAAVEDLLERLPAGRLFLYVHYMEPHDYGSTGGSYARAVAKVDRHVGSLLESLESRGLLEDTVVFFTSDHGELLGESHPGFGTSTHKGNPSFQPVLEVPLIVRPPVFEDSDRFVRGQDLGDMIREVAGIPVGPEGEGPELRPDEHFLSEMNYLTYRQGRFKSVFHRTRMRQWALFDLESDPEEQDNLIQSTPEPSLRHMERVGELAGEGSDADLSDEDRARLQALGYLEELEALEADADRER